jgi:hypothetical protein
MTLLSTLAAYDLGYLGPSELSLRVRNAFGSIKRLAHYQGHLFNWYETKNLEPLLPRYVSVENPDSVACGIAMVTLDGAGLESNRIPLDPSLTGEHEVHVLLGEGSRPAGVAGRRREVGGSSAGRAERVVQGVKDTP